MKNWKNRWFELGSDQRLKYYRQVGFTSLLRARQPIPSLSPLSVTSVPP